jgi:hypothetical protein
MKTKSSSAMITGILFRLAILACGIGGVTAALFAAAGALEHRAPPPAADAAKVGPTFAARDTVPPRARSVETAPVAFQAPGRPGAALPADRPTAQAPAAARQEAALLPPAAEQARAIAPAEPVIEQAAQRPALDVSRTRPTAAATASLDPAARPALGIDETPPAAASAPTAGPSGASSATPAGRPQRGAQGCTQYRTYDARTGTYRGFDGKVRECNAVASN